MDIQELKIATGYLVTESELSRDAKIQLLNFIQKEATEVQLMALLMDGKIITVDEQSEEIIRDRFKASALEAGVLKKALHGSHIPLLKKQHSSNMTKTHILMILHIYQQYQLQCFMINRASKYMQIH